MHEEALYRGQQISLPGSLLTRHHMNLPQLTLQDKVGRGVTHKVNQSHFRSRRKKKGEDALQLYLPPPRPPSPNIPRVPLPDYTRFSRWVVEFYFVFNSKYVN